MLQSLPRSPAIRLAVRVLAPVWLSTALILTALSAAAGTFYRLDFEDAQMNQTGVKDGKKTYKQHIQGGGTFGKLLYDDRKGSTVLELRTSPTPDGAHKDRTEVKIHSGVYFDRDWYVGLQVFVPEDVTFSDTWHLLLQCAQPPGKKIARSPPISLNLMKNGNLALISRNDADTYKRLWSTPMPTGRWVYLMLHLHMGDNGQTRLWMDGALKTDRKMRLGWATGEERCVLKTGIYRGDAETPFVIRLDNITLGDSPPPAPRD